ncbi:hypothetical protein MSAN_02389400 [Mycena sanguinolenta]|uniref:Uncharacterized protein n=1 Tax=Mycena sanguinolenta TaxID=230812 RepID=A0A8H6X4F5_9AGAR|nr:hypothetical protein MSAN_02389400 [Mycena sanguinolenta]
MVSIKRCTDSGESDTGHAVTAACPNVHAPQMQLLLWVLSLLFMTCFAAQTIHNELPTDLICTPAGDCEPCPADYLQEPFCQPFGSRRLMHCANGTAPPIPEHTAWPPILDNRDTTTSIPRAAEQPHSHTGETLAWAACGRIVRQERADFFEFVACNLLFAAFALFGVLTRSRRLRAIQARQLAARIGLGRQ